MSAFGTHVEILQPRKDTVPELAFPPLLDHLAQNHFKGSMTASSSQILVESELADLIITTFL